jgi:hypothetical protein
VDAHLLWIYIKDMFSDTTTSQDSRGSGCLIKPVRPIEKTGQTGLAKSAGSRLQRRKRHCVRIDGPRGGELGFLFVFKTLM